MTSVLIHPATYETVRPAVDRAFEIFPINLSGKKVLIKPNALRTSSADEAIVTHPSVLRAVVEKVETLDPCGTCVTQCPVSALTMSGDFPEVDVDTCITCFCCQELCPEKAIQLG
ncbi:MAG: DUF362 domain-containing protein [Desulfobacteraceae bacterium]|nr:DUF362 domain-containing protein [Desulfobacteraceae bacterium]MBC2757579.1 DUF362 domain-containing protein [Desulfobacteraceae bacterium]